jgi:hypothetical protein
MPLASVSAWRKMKTTFKISVLLNLLLLVCLSFLWFHPQNRGIVPTPPMAAKAEAQAPAPVTRTGLETEPFHWSQLLSSNDYLIFVSNLRTAGCPESTVEDIVWGDTDRAYSAMRGRLGVGPSDPGPWSAQAQIKMAAYFLGQKPGTTPETSAAPSLPMLAATPPLVLQNVELSTLKLDEAQTQAIASIRETFLSSIGGADQNTNDPAFLARWQKAEYEADNMLQAMLGAQAFAQYQAQAYQMSLLNQETSAGN